jgi:pimeloyl-ACP methyl ester carboxylesterase
METKHFTPNRYGKEVAIVVERPAHPIGLAFIMHGLGGFKEQPHIKVIKDACLANGFVTVIFDATHTIGESDGRYEDATVTNYYEDLQDVIAWSADMPWYKEPFLLIGHSLGGMCTALYAEAHPEKVLALAPLATSVSGEASLKQYGADAVREWEETGFRSKESKSRPGTTLRLGKQFIEDSKKYDILTDAGKLTMPVLLLVGEHDDTTPPVLQKGLFDALPGASKQYEIVASSGHTFRDAKPLNDLSRIMTNWLESLVSNPVV